MHPRTLIFALADLTKTLTHLSRVICVVLATTASALLCSCTSLGMLDQNVVAPRNGESVFVFGIAPANHRISVFPGRIDHGLFYQNQWRPAAVFGAAQNGYVVGKGSAGDVLAITNVRVVRSAGDLLGEDFSPCSGATTIVFNVPQGQVIYLGNVEYSFDGPKLLIRYGDDLAAARTYIDAHYPALKGRLQQASFQLLPVATGCISNGRTIYVPVYVHRR